MSLYEMKARHRELMTIAESDVMLASEFDELMALYAMIKRAGK